MKPISSDSCSLLTKCLGKSWWGSAGRWELGSSNQTLWEFAIPWKSLDCCTCPCWRVSRTSSRRPRCFGASSIRLRPRGHARGSIQPPFYLNQALQIRARRWASMDSTKFLVPFLEHQTSQSCREPALWQPWGLTQPKQEEQLSRGICMWLLWKESSCTRQAYWDSTVSTPIRPSLLCHQVRMFEDQRFQ